MAYRIEKLGSAKFKQDLVNKVNELVDAVNGLLEWAPQQVDKVDVPVQSLHGWGDGAPNQSPADSKE